MTLTVRDARADDAEALFRIQRAASLAALGHVFPPDRYPFPDDEVRTRWRAAVSEPDLIRRVLLAERDGRPVGVVAFAPATLEALYVAPEAWRGGVGSRLHDEAVRELRGLGDEARLWVLEHNATARAFYERRGWRLDGRERVVPFPPHPLDVGYSLRLR